MNTLLKKYRNKSNEKGFTLIELMIVVAIIGILAAIAIPNFLGMQEKAKRRAIEESVSSTKSEVHNFLQSALSSERGVVDTDGNGIVTPTEAAPAQANVATSFIAAFYAKKGGTVWSPWDSTVELFTTGTPGTGQIGVVLTNSSRTVILTGMDAQSNTLVQDTVSVD